jgi:hypothetical protein
VLERRRPDVVVVGPWTTAEHALPHLRRPASGATVVVDSCDLHFLREQREAEVRGEPVSAEMSARRRRELAVYAAADHVVCVTVEEADLLARELPGIRVSVVGNVHPAVESDTERSARTGLLFVGNANHAPNVDAVRWWRDEIGPRLAGRLPEAELTVVGNDPRGALRALAGPGVRVQGWVPDVGPYLQNALVSVAPLRYGAGMKGKVGEALAAGVPVVATSIAAEGMRLRDSQHALLADDADSFVDAVVRLHDDAVLWERLRSEGRRHVEQLAGLDAVRQQLTTLLSRLDGTAVPASSRRERRAALRAGARGRGRHEPVSGPVQLPRQVPLGGRTSGRRHPVPPQAGPRDSKSATS